MINEKEFEQLEKEIKTYDSLREKLIKDSRDVLKLSKQLIYSIHRNEKDSSKLLDKIKTSFSALQEHVKKHPKLEFEGSYKIAAQEYAEAVLYYGFVTEKRLLSRKELNLSAQYYLLGICDLSGELYRRAVHEKIENNIDEVKIITKFISDLYWALLKFDFRSGDLRKKVDGIKYDIKKFEELLLR